MIASPLPNTKTPATAKNVKSTHKVPLVVAIIANGATKVRGDRLTTPDFPFLQRLQEDHE
jgi:hypothetical protein